MPWLPKRGFAAEAAALQPDTPDALLRRRVSEANMVLQVCCQHWQAELFAFVLQPERGSCDTHKHFQQVGW